MDPKKPTIYAAALWQFLRFALVGILSVFAINYDRLKVRAYRVQPSDWPAFKGYLGESYRQDNLPEPPGQRVMDQTVNLDAVPDALTEIYGRLGEGLVAQGFEVETRRYRPHVTLARKVRQPTASTELTPIDWQVRELALVESRSGAVPMYQPLARWALR